MKISTRREERDPNEIENRFQENTKKKPGKKSNQNHSFVQEKTMQCFIRRI